MLKKIISAAIPIIFASKIVFSQHNQNQTIYQDIRVVDKKTGEALPGANILIGKTNGTSTDIQGYSKINIDNEKKAHLRISYVGYEPLDTVLNYTSENNKNNKNNPIMLFMKQKQIESDEIIVSTNRKESLQEKLSDKEEISEKSAEKTNLISGNSLSDKIFAQTTGFTATTGKNFFYSSGREDLQITWNGIERTVQGLFGYDAIISPENMEFEVYPFAAPPEKTKGMIGIISVETKKPEHEKIKFSGSLDHLRGATAMTGNLPFMDETWFNVSGEWNIASIWNIKDLSPRKNEYTFSINTKKENQKIALNGLYVNSSLMLKGKQFEPSQNDVQAASSILYETTTKDYNLQGMYVFNYATTENIFTNAGSIKNSKKIHNLQGRLTIPWKENALITGFNSALIEYSQNITKDKNHEFLNLFSIPIAEKNKNFFTSPVYIYGKWETAISQNLTGAVGLNVLTDILYPEKEIALAPYLKIEKKAGETEISLTYSKRLNDVDFKPFADEFSVGEYITKNFPKSHQLSVEVKNKPLGARLSFYKFYDQHHSNTRINYFQNAFYLATQNINSDSLKATILISKPELLADPQALRNLDRMITEISYVKQKVGQELDIYGRDFSTNRNREGVALDLWLRTENAYFSATFSTTKEDATSTPYSNDINLILKSHLDKNFSMFGQDFSASLFVEYSTGKPFTPMRLAPSIAEEKNLQNQINLFKEAIPEEYIDLLTQKRQVSSGKNSSRYPPSIISSLGISSEIKDFFGMKVLMSAYILDPHLLIPGIQKNTLQLYYTLDNNQNLILRRGTSSDVLGGFSIRLEL